MQQRFVVAGSAVIVLAALGYVLFGQHVNPFPRQSKSSQANQASASSDKPKVLKHFTNDQFRSMYSTFIYPNTQPITTPPDITGNADADARIRKVAESRGYKLTALPVASIVKTGEPGLDGDDLMQPNALIAWKQLKDAAKKDGITLTMTSAYRSIDYQRGLFLRRMQNTGVNVYTILDGHADDELVTVLSRAAPPGYSRHHTGYTMDLSCNGVGLEAFIGTNCYKWISQNNFENIKKFGWIPSYPEGSGNHGPEPESWEYVWVGTTSLYE